MLKIKYFNKIYIFLHKILLFQFFFENFNISSNTVVSVEAAKVPRYSNHKMWNWVLASDYV